MRFTDKEKPLDLFVLWYNQDIWQHNKYLARKTQRIYSMRKESKRKENHALEAFMPIYYWKLEMYLGQFIPHFESLYRPFLHFYSRD